MMQQQLTKKEEEKEKKAANLPGPKVATFTPEICVRTRNTLLCMMVPTLQKISAWMTTEYSKLLKIPASFPQLVVSHPTYAFKIPGESVSALALSVALNLG